MSLIVLGEMVVVVDLDQVNRTSPMSKMMAEYLGDIFDSIQCMEIKRILRLWKQDRERERKIYEGEKRKVRKKKRDQRGLLAVSIDLIAHI